jgi:hypothetical protein
MDMDELIKRWLNAYNSALEFNEENFDGEMVQAMFDLSGEERLFLIEKLAEENLTPAAEGLLGAGLFEDVITERPDLVETIAKKIESDQSLLRVLRHAWVTEKMSPAARELVLCAHEIDKMKTQKAEISKSV